MNDKQRLRETAQILIAEIGADGPMDADEAARAAVAEIRRLRAIIADERIRTVRDNPPPG